MNAPRTLSHGTPRLSMALGPLAALAPSKEIAPRLFATAGVTVRLARWTSPGSVATWSEG